MARIYWGGTGVSGGVAGGVPGLAGGLGELPDPLPGDGLPDEPLPVPVPNPLPKLEPPTGVEVLLAGWPTEPVLPGWRRMSVSGS